MKLEVPIDCTVKPSSCPLQQRSAVDCLTVERLYVLMSHVTSNHTKCCTLNAAQRHSLISTYVSDNKGHCWERVAQQCHHEEATRLYSHQLAYHQPWPRVSKQKVGTCLELQKMYTHKSSQSKKQKTRSCPHILSLIVIVVVHWHTLVACLMATPEEFRTQTACSHKQYIVIPQTKTSFIVEQGAFLNCSETCAQPANSSMKSKVGSPWGSLSFKISTNIMNTGGNFHCSISLTVADMAVNTPQPFLT